MAHSYSLTPSVNDSGNDNRYLVPREMSNGRAKEHRSRGEMSKSFVTFGAELPWIFPLVLELSRFGPSLAISLGASSLTFRRTVAWPYDESNNSITKEVWSYPPGFNRKLGFLFNRPIRSRLMRTIRRLCHEASECSYVILPNPRFQQYVKDVDPAKLIYLNYDDYAIDFSASGRSENPAEKALVNSARAVLCSSAYQTARFKRGFPEKAKNIFHFPHGVHEAFLNPNPGQLPTAPTVCINGRLTSRYDWPLIEEVVSQLPAVSFIFLGAIETATHPGQRSDWLKCLHRVLDLANVQHRGGLKHLDTRLYYWQSAINWMPYNTGLPFVRASCPLKIVDGFASGRQVISADVPECRLYPEWISIYRDTAEAIPMIRDAVGRALSDQEAQRSRRQIEFAAANSWRHRAARLVSILER